MSRRRSCHRDPASSWIDTADRQLILRQTAESMPRMQWDVLVLYYGLNGKPPMTLQQIGYESALSAKLTYELFWRATRSINDNSQTQAALADLSGRPVVPKTLQEAGIVYCDIPGHGYTIDDGRRCGMCACAVEWKRNGRPPEYCSPGCKQKAYRQRKASQVGQ